MPLNHTRRQRRRAASKIHTNKNQETANPNANNPIAATNTETNRRAYSRRAARSDSINEWQK